MSGENKTDGKFWFGFFLGGLIGAITLFFLGTKEGRKAGKNLKDQGQDLLDDMRDRLETLKEKGKELAVQGEDLKVAVAESVSDEKSKLTKEMTHKLDEALAHIEEIQERGRETTANIRKGLFKNTPKKN